MIVYRRYPNKAVKDSYTPAIIKIQTILMALSLPLFLLSLFTVHFIYLALSLWAVIMVSAIPFSIKTSKKDILVGIISPLVILLRSFVFAMGSVLGIIRSIF